jgi:hypothetical protein
VRADAPDLDPVDRLRADQHTGGTRSGAICRRWSRTTFLVQIFCARGDVDRGSIRAAAQGVKGMWLQPIRIRKVWLDKTPYSLLEAIENMVNTNLSDAVIHGFALH